MSVYGHKNQQWMSMVYERNMGVIIPCLTSEYKAEFALEGRKHNIINDTIPLSTLVCTHSISSQP